MLDPCSSQALPPYGPSSIFSSTKKMCLHAFVVVVVAMLSKSNNIQNNSWLNWKPMFFLQVVRNTFYAPQFNWTCEAKKMYLHLIRCYLRSVEVNQDVLDSLTVCYQSLEAHLMFCATSGSTTLQSNTNHNLAITSSASLNTIHNNNTKKILPRAISREKKSARLKFWCLPTHLKPIDSHEIYKWLAATRA